MTQPSKAKIKIEQFTDDRGYLRHRLYLNGHDISSQTRGIDFHLGTDNRPTTKLTIFAHVELELFSEIEYVVADEGRGDEAA